MCTILTTKKAFSTPGGHPWSRARAPRAAIAFVLFLAAGCNSDPFAVPPPPDLASDRDNLNPPLSTPGLDVASPEARTIELVLDRHEPDESDTFTTAARTQAGLDHARLRVTMLPQTDLSSRQAELVREAASRKPLAIVLEPSDPADPRLAQAVADATREIPVFVLYRALTGFESAQARPAEGRLSLVVPPSFKESAARLVTAASRNAKNAGLDPSAGAILVINTVSDPFLEDRIAAIKAACQSIGIKTISEVRFAMKAEEGMRLLKDKLKSDSRPAIAIALDEPAMTASHQINNQLVEERPFTLAGYSFDTHLVPNVRSGDLAAIAEFTPTRLIRKAISVAASGKPGVSNPARIEGNIEVFESSQDAGLPKMQSFYRAQSRGSNALPKSK